MYEHFAFMYICLPCTLLMSNEVSRGCWVPKNWNYRQLWADMWMLGMEAKSSGKAAGLTNQWAVIQTPFVYYPTSWLLSSAVNIDMRNFLVYQLCLTFWLSVSQSTLHVTFLLVKVAVSSLVPCILSLFFLGWWYLNLCFRITVHIYWRSF